MDERVPVITYHIRATGRRLDIRSCRIQLVKSIVFNAIYQKDEKGNELFQLDPILCRTYHEEVYEIPAINCNIFYDHDMGWVANIQTPIEPKIEAIIDPINEKETVDTIVNGLNSSVFTANPNSEPKPKPKPKSEPELTISNLKGKETDYELPRD